MGQGEYKHVYRAMESGKINITPSNQEKEENQVNAEEGPATAPPKNTEPASVRSTPLADIKSKILDQEGYGFTRKSKGPKKGTETIRPSEAEAFKKSLKEGERLANLHLQGTMEGKSRKFKNMKQVIDYFRANPEELERRGNQFQHYILTQIQKGTGKR